MAVELLDKYFITLFLIIGFSMKLWTKRGATDYSRRFYWLTVFSTLILIAADSMELWARSSVDLRFIRVLFSVIGYTMRPVAALSIVLIIYPTQPRPFVLWLPALGNALVYCTAFFTPSIAFGYTETNNFTRGLLGYTVFAVSFFYIIFAVFLTWRCYRDKDHMRERFGLYLCACACIAAALIDMETDGVHVNSAIMVSSVFLFMFFRSIDTNRDPLTNLLNRMSFFEDCSRYGGTISAVGSADMNGLKKLNDTAGHEAGDEALRVIGKSLKDLSRKGILAYRIGGDEFALLFIRQDEETVHRTMRRLAAAVAEKGYHISTGYAYRGERYASVQDLIRWADENMYADKAKYYSVNKHDRRRSARQEQSETGPLPEVPGS